MDGDETFRLLLRVGGVAVLRGVLDSAAARGMLELLELLRTEHTDAISVASTFGRLWEELAHEEDFLLPDAWQSHLVSWILEDENPFSLRAERGEVSEVVERQVRHDLRALQALFDLDAETLLTAVEEKVPEARDLWVPWTDQNHADEDSSRNEVARKLASVPDWAGCTELLAGHFQRHGAGALGRYRAFRWRDGKLTPIERPDPVRLDDLVGYEHEHELLKRNTERLISGTPSHHALLYGLPGTGKSSTVKAIANEYADRGLRLVEVVKEELGELPRVLGALEDRGLSFIVFVDDLSFEEQEIEYKTLKALLEGTVAEPPKNVRVYATSNRRNVVRESFAERDEDVHSQDTMQEKLSLSARFGLRVTFPSPDQKEYLRIVSGLARQRGIEIPNEHLTERALSWDRWRSGRSGRTARQFVDELEAELSETR